MTCVPFNVFNIDDLYNADNKSLDYMLCKLEHILTVADTLFRLIFVPNVYINVSIITKFICIDVFAVTTIN